MVNQDENPAKYLSLESIFKNRTFKIPDYQRGYAWDTRQVDDLINDIMLLMENQNTHFTGTIVAIRSDERDALFDIVDGQQRLTTILIILKCIHDRNVPQYSYLFEQYIERKINGDSIVVLKHNKESKDFYYDYIIRDNKPDPEVNSHENLKTAKEKIEKWLKDFSESEKIVEILTHRLKFIFFTPDDFKEAGLMFEVINNRGKRLSELEKIKNYFIYYSTIFESKSLRDFINNKWSEILKYLNKSLISSKQEENQFLRYTYLVFYSHSKDESWHVYRQLKEEWHPISGISTNSLDESTEKIREYIEFLVQSAKALAFLDNHNFFCSTDRGDNKKDLLIKVLGYIRCHPVRASIMPLYLLIMTKMMQGKCSTKTTVELLNILERLNFRVYVLPKVTSRADSKQAELFRYANEFYGTAMDDTAMSKLKDKLIEFTLSNCSADTLVKNLTIDKDDPEDYERWHGLRYFLARYEEHLQSKKSTTFDVRKVLKSRRDGQSGDYLSIEHIWARDNRRKLFPADHFEKRRLGNLVLLNLRRNIQFQNDHIEKKVDMIEKESDSMFQVNELKKILDKAKNRLRRKYKRKSKYYPEYLSGAINDIREIKLIEFALESWKLPGDNVDRRIDSYIKGSGA